MPISTMDRRSASNALCRDTAATAVQISAGAKKRSPEMIRNTEAKRQAKHLRDAEEAARRALEGTALIGHLHRRFCKILLILANLNIVQIWQKLGNFADFARK